MVSRLQGAIIAAGRGERLRKGGEDIPKPLVTLEGEPLLSRQARAMMRAGAQSVLAIVNSETAGMIERERGKIQLPDKLQLMVRDTANSMESLLALGERLNAGPFLLATVDAVIPDVEFRRFVSTGLTMMQHGGAQTFDAVLGIVRWRGDRKPLFAKVSPSGEIVALGEDEAPTVTAGVYLLPSRIFDFADEARAAGLNALRRFLRMLIDKRMRLGAIELAQAIDVDEMADLAAARAALGVRR